MPHRHTSLPLLLVASALASCAGSPLPRAPRAALAAFQEPSAGASVESSGRVVIELAEPIDMGRVRVALHSDPDAFGGGPPAFGGVFGPGEPLVLDGVAPGTYGLIVHHDEDGDGELGRNFLSIPVEPLAFAGGYRPTGRPSFDRSLVVVRSGETTTERVALARLLGEGGTIGVGAGAVVQGLPYRGASGAQINPIPIVAYISEDLAIVGPQVQYSLAAADRARVSATLRARFPAYDEDDAPILDGLGDRDIVALGGLQVEVDLTGVATLRLTYEHDLLGTVGGGEATASLRRGFHIGKVDLTPSFGVRWVDEQLVDHDFGVPAADANASRAAYSPSNGLYLEANLATRAQLSDHLQLVLNVGAQLFDDEVTDSPLVEDEHRISGVFGLVYTL